jgi:SNF family Na+-dependent transporter
MKRSTNIKLTWLIFYDKGSMEMREFGSRERWATRIGIVLAMAGNAIGLGNFLRFPVQATQNGGGAFMIPYFCALIFLALPLMWAEWAMGRFGGARGHGTTPGIFDKLWKSPVARYVGVFGILLPLGVGIYYCYIESWTLAYSFFSITKKYFGIFTREEMSTFLKDFQGTGEGRYFSGIWVAYGFFLLTFLINFSVLYRGISRGIELLAKIAMPLLFIFALVLVVRVFTLGTPDPAYPERNVLNGLGFIWNPDLSQLSNAKIWLAAAGQIFFSTSVGFGAIHCYASYLKERDDIAVTGFSTVMTNEFCEVILGSSIAIPIAFAFFGYNATLEIAKGGSFDLGFVSLPIIFQKIPLGAIFGMLWFLLLFFAGITSSVAIFQPAITFLQDELNLKRERAVILVSGFVFLAAHIPIFGLRYGALDEIDFWIGTFGVSLFALIECIVFVWIFGSKNAWKEMNLGAQINIPRMFLYILKYITPFYLLFIFIMWSVQKGPSVLFMEGAKGEEVLWRWIARGLILATIGIILYLIAYAWKRRADHGTSD